jgi:hypothetical protein
MHSPSLLPKTASYSSKQGFLTGQTHRRLHRQSSDSLQDRCEQLSRLVDQGPTLIDFMIARSLERRAYAADQALLEHTPLTALQIAKTQEDLDRLPPLPKVADRLDVGERFECLSTISYYSRQAELHYRREGKGYCLYSVGNNGKDDGGKGIVNGNGDDESVKKNWDDMVIRMPAVQKQ